jgi:molybdopterin converting factor small subunit
MSVKIDVPPFLKHLTDDIKVATVNGNTVGECIENFIKRYPDAKKLLFDKDGNLLGYVDIFVNGESAYPEELNKPVSDGDELSIMFLLVGG